jgi:hypothetical protein
MGKIDEALIRIESIKDPTERAMTLGGLASTLLKLKGVTPIIVGRLAYDIYLGNTDQQKELILATYSGRFTPRVLQEIFGEQLRGTGLIWKWRIASTDVRITGEALLERKELCRDFRTDYGVVKLIPVEELLAERLLASFYPKPNEQARYEAKRLLMLGLAESLPLDWPALQELCNSELYRAGEQLASLRTEAKQEVDTALAAEEVLSGTTPSPASPSTTSTSLGSTTTTA